MKRVISSSNWGFLRPHPALPAALLAAMLNACVDPMDVTGVTEVVTERQEKDPLADELLSDKHPDYDATRTVSEEFAGCTVALNKSASVTRLTSQSAGALDDAVRAKIFPSRAAARAALNGAPTLPSIEVVNGALKPFNDGLYAAVELAAEAGTASEVDKHQLLLDLLAELMKRSSGGNAAEKAPALAAARHIASALTLAGEASAVDASLRTEAATDAAAFERASIYSKPIGFYTWTPALESIFKRDRWLQQRYIPGVVPSPAPFAALAELGLVVNQPGPLSASYRRTLDLYAGLTDPFFDHDPFALSQFVPDAAALGDLGSLQASVDATLPVNPDSPYCNPGLSAFPASESAENRIMRQLLCGKALAEGETLLDGLIRKIQSGELDLTPRANSGFYDQQLYALQTLLVPESANESQHLLLTRAYKEKLVETFKSLLIQTRETHVKQIALVDARASSVMITPIEFDVYPQLLVEPFPTYYLRTARAYRFLEGVLSTVLGREFLDTTARLIEDGSRAALSLRDELSEKQLLLYGLHAVSADSIGMAPELAEDEQAEFPLDAARQAARAWLANVDSDSDVARDPRVSLPVAFTADGESAIYWAVVGVKVIHLSASFPETHRPEVQSVTPFECTLRGWTSFEPYMLVEQTIELKRSVLLPPLNRQEFRALCDQHAAADAIAQAFAGAP